jgi:hypothetical protein
MSGWRWKLWRPVIKGSCSPLINDGPFFFLFCFCSSPSLCIACLCPQFVTQIEVVFY